MCQALDFFVRYQQKPASVAKKMTEKATSSASPIMAPLLLGNPEAEEAAVEVEVDGAAVAFVGLAVVVAEQRSGISGGKFLFTNEAG
ncbi:hypothetical protein K3495_g11638 [Podosphaera aphanis]|nr:hypothetical protein K3495_g11638 [Podosphaera aphanis]